ncbi:hypothetical protein Glove_11g64 [Diversispora epigaea]|uniref:Uncharacterized protein n=1 Tax=Diversispora epigaea TaxID=1348612 RepID=A0A397JZ48_9GLOM|nr:hypothetical protein Glove_11g64 [Diversispora epigaea]
MSKKNTGPCSIKNCTYSGHFFCRITELAYQKCEKENMLEVYSYLNIGEQLCHQHYCQIVESKRNKRKRKINSKNQKDCRKKVEHKDAESCLSNTFLINDQIFASKVKILTSVLYNKQHRETTKLKLEPTEFQNMIENASPELKRFFPSMVNAIIPKERSAYNKQEAKKSIVALCYMIAGLRNKFVNQFKTEVGLYLAASGATWEAIDIMSSLGYSICAKSVANYQKKIQENHIIEIESYFSKNGNFLHIYNIDDFHDIHEKRRPDTTSTSTANHFSTCVTKPVIDCLKIPLIFNGISVHNPNNIEAWRICWYLLNKYTGIFDITYTECQLQGYQDN